MVLVLLIFGAWALSNLGKETVILSRLWSNMSQNEKTSIQNAYKCCGATYYGAWTDPATCTCAPCSGCFSPLITDFRNMYTAFGALFIIVASIMIVTLVVAFCLVSGIANAQENQAKGKRGGRK